MFFFLNSLNKEQALGGLVLGGIHAVEQLARLKSEI